MGPRGRSRRVSTCSSTRASGEGQQATAGCSRWREPARTSGEISPPPTHASSRSSVGSPRNRHGVDTAARADDSYAGVGMSKRRGLGGRAVLSGVLVALALLATPAAVADAPTVNVPGDIVEEATSSAGADVSWGAVDATDTEDGTIPADCNPTSGSTFALGDTTVTCTATDSLSDAGSASFTVTVQDTTDPTVTVPSPITKEATGPDGAVVTFSASASDNVSGPLTPSCSPSSGDTFQLGTTNVTCT